MNIFNDTSVLRYAERAGARSLVHMAAPYIKDYRIQYAILNDYSLFFELNGAKRLKTSAFVNMAEQILALAIYKNIWPKHYDKVTSGESSDFFYTEITESKELAELLVDPEHPFLLYENLCYLGYSREKLIYNIINYIKDEEPFYSKSDVISSFPSDEFHIAAVHEFAENEVPKEEIGHNIDEIVRLLTAITRYYIRSNTVDMSNILEKRDIHLCLRTLAALSEGEWKKYINNVKKELRWHWDSENRNTFNIFKNCLNIEFVATRTDWTEKEIEIFVYGTNDTEKYKGIHLHAKNSDGKPIVIDLEESIRQRNIQKVIPNIMV